MTQFRNIKDIFQSLIKDGKIVLLILATILITVSYTSSYFVQFSFESLARVFISYIPFAFTGLMIAWIVTDKSILRKPYPYLGIFLFLFIYKVYWSLFYWIFPEPITNSPEILGSIEIGTTNIPRTTSGWLNLQNNAFYFYIIVELVVIVGIFLLFWYLTHPSDFLKHEYKKLDLLKNKRTVFFVLGVFFMSMHIWLWNLIYFLSEDIFHEFFTNVDLFMWVIPLINIIPIAIGLIFFSMLITRIKDHLRYVLYLIVFIFTIIPSIPIYYMLGLNWRSSLFGIFHFLIYLISFFILFLSFILLSKTKYIEQ